MRKWGNEGGGIITGMVMTDYYGLLRDDHRTRNTRPVRSIYAAQDYIMAAWRRPRIRSTWAPCPPRSVDTRERYTYSEYMIPRANTEYCILPQSPTPRNTPFTVLLYPRCPVIPYCVRRYSVCTLGIYRYATTHVCI